MADIELIIKIDEKTYNKITHAEFDARLVVNKMRQAIENGTPLPKGHGRLIDADEFHHILEDMPIRDTDKWFNWLQKACNRLAEVPPIVEADRRVKKNEICIHRSKRRRNEGK